MADDGISENHAPRSNGAWEEVLATLPPEMREAVRAKIAAFTPEQLAMAPPAIAPVPRPSGPRLQVNLVPGAPPRPFVEVPFAASAISDKLEATFKDSLGADRWPAFKRLLDEFSWSIRCADDAVELLSDAITDDDFTRWSPKARKELDVATARFAMIDADLDGSPEYANQMRAKLSALETRYARLAAKGPPQTSQLRITGEYER